MLHIITAAALGSCMCSDMTLCNPLQFKAAKEVVAFAPHEGAWKEYNMSVLTTIVKFGEVDPSLVCEAHKAGVKVVVSMGFDKSQLGNETAMDGFVTHVSSLISEEGYDGFNFDIEANNANAAGLTRLVSKTASALRSANPYAQITFDTSIWMAGNNTGYDYAGLNEILDFFIPMAYDMCGGDTARQNSPIDGIKTGLQRYQSMGLLDKVVLGVPWYGYQFVCDKPSPSGGCPYTRPSNMGSWQKCFDSILPTIPKATVPPAYTPEQDAVFFTYEAGSTIYQVYYDNATTLSNKYDLISSMGLKGTAFWYGGCAAMGTPQGAAMWHALEGIKA
eukprot:TRINITY_DN8874_c2_g1_i3.p1 TRINITY_DN8874_c2_g1~~TRINITY_DN8874_c2_g1_i3.p1  ORF type:complete len:333 (+),score=53.40 TRINITY_DN8874_c2_g1_i3:197-1195(+)